MSCLHFQRRSSISKWAMLIAGMLAIPVQMVPADEVYWTGLGGDASFTNPINWNTENVPGVGDMAIFNDGNTSYLAVDLDQNWITNQALMIRNDQVHISTGGNAYELTNPEFSLYVGVYSGEVGQLLYTGSLYPRSVQVGYHDGAEGYFTLMGNGTLMDLGPYGFGDQGFLEIGNGGNGQFHISHEAYANVRWVKLGMWENAHGELLVSNSAQLVCNYNEFIIVGERGQGTLTVDRFGKVLGTYIMTATNTENGQYAPVGNIWVSGEGSQLIMEHQIELGNQGIGIMTVDQGATASTGGFGGMVVGVEGQGELYIESGGVLTSTDDSSIARGINSQGRARVTGLDSRWDIQSATLVVGVAGQAGTDHNNPGLLIDEAGRLDAGQLHVGGFTSYYDPDLDTDFIHTGTGYITVRGTPAEDYLPPSRLQVMDVSLIGNGGFGDVHVQQGGVFETANIAIGRTGEIFNHLDHLQKFDGFGYVTVQDPSSILRVTSGQFIIGQSSEGRLYVENGGKAVSVNHVSGWQDGNGNWVPEPPDPANPPDGYVATTSSAWVIIGDEANGDGGLSVWGNGSIFQNDNAPIIVGNYGSGTVYLLWGGELHNPHGEMWVGSNEGSYGHVAVTGVGSRLIQHHPNGYQSEIGGAGHGTMTLNDGGYAEFTELHLGQMPTGLGDVNVWHPTTMLNITHGNLVVADQGMGFLSVYEQAQVQVAQGNLFIGTYEFSMGQVLVTGDGSKLTALGASENDYGSWVGRSGMGELFINDLGMVHLHRLTIGEQVTGYGVVSITDGAMLKVNQDINLGWVDQGTGLIGLSGGIIEVGQTLAIGPNGTLAGTGEVRGHVYNGFGAVSPGHSPGLLTLGSYYQDVDGTLTLDIIGLVRGSEYDGLDVTDDATITGKIQLVFNVYAPKTGDYFDLVISAKNALYFAPDLMFEVYGLGEGWQYELADVDGALRLTSLNDAVLIPEPVALSLLFPLGAGLLVRRRSSLA